MKVLKEDVIKKAEELLALLPNLEIHVDGRHRAVYVNSIYFSFEEFMSLNIEIIKHPSFWGV